MAIFSNKKMIEIIYLSEQKENTAMEKHFLERRHDLILRVLDGLCVVLQIENRICVLHAFHDKVSYWMEMIFHKAVTELLW